MDRSVIADVPREKYVERCKQRAFDYIDRGDLKSAVSSFVNNMDARPDCELPHHLADLGQPSLRERKFTYSQLGASFSRTVHRRLVADHRLTTETP